MTLIGGIVAGLISFLGWGTGDIFGAYSSRKIGGVATSFLASIASFVFALFLLPFAPGKFADFTPFILTLNIFLALFAILGNISLNISLKSSNAQIAGTIAGSFPVVVILIGILIFHDQISFLELSSIILIFTGIILCSLDKSDQSKSNFWKDRGIHFAFLAMICWGIYFSFIRVVMEKVGWFIPHFVAIMIAIPSGYLIYKMTNESAKISFKSNFYKIFGAVVCCAILLRTGDFAFNIAIQNGFSGIAGAIGGAYPALFVILSHFIFKDPLTRFQKQGITIALLGIILLSFVSYYL